MRDSFTAIGGSVSAAVDLTGAQVGRMFMFAKDQPTHTADPRRRLAVDGLTYAGVPRWRPCTVVQQLSVGLDLNLPVGTSLARSECALTRDSASATAKWLTVAGWVIRVLAWAFAALFIAGFTGAVRKT